MSVAPEEEDIRRAVAEGAILGPEPEPYDGDKPAEEIEQDIAQTRAELADTLDALEHRLSPRHLLEKGVDMLRDSVNDDFGRIGESIRANPLPLALIGAGIGWFVLSQTGGSRVVGDAARSARDEIGRRVSDVAGRAGEVAGRVKTMAGMGSGNETYATEGSYAYARQKTEGGSGEAWRTARDSAGEAAHGARQRLGEYAGRAGDYASSAGERLSRARDRAGDLLIDHPLAVGALGLFAGFIAALMLPATRVEDEYFGDTRERAMDQAREFGRDALDSAERAASAAMDAAAEAVREEVGGEDGEAEAHRAAKPKRATDPGSSKHEKS